VASRISVIDVIHERAAAAATTISGRRYLSRRVATQPEETHSADAH
jgi:hypothetical protein